MKALTRFLRAEFNGKYINALYQSYAELIKPQLDFISHLNSLSFDTITDEELDSLMVALSIFSPTIEAYGLPTFLTFPESGITKLKHIENQQWQDIESPPSIAEDSATEEDRAGFIIPENNVILGYIPASATDVFDDNGNVKLEKVLATPPADEAYSIYYKKHNNFLYIPSQVYINTHLSRERKIEYIEIMQLFRIDKSFNSFRKLCDFVNAKDLFETLYLSQNPNTNDQILVNYKLKQILPDNYKEDLALFFFIIRAMLVNFICVEV